MVDFLFAAIPLIALYFVIRFIFRTSVKHNKLTLLFYIVVTLLWILISYDNIESKGFGYFIYTDLIPVIIPFIIHLIFINKNQIVKKKYNKKNNKGKLILSLFIQKLILLIFLLITITINILLIVFTNRKELSLFCIISFSIFIIIILFYLLILIKYKYQKIVILKGETLNNVFIFDLPKSFIVIKCRTIISLDEDLYDFIGTAFILILNEKKQEQHFIYKIKTEEDIDLSSFKEYVNHYYKDLYKYINQINNQKFRVIVKDNQIIDFHS